MMMLHHAPAHRVVTSQPVLIRLVANARQTANGQPPLGWQTIRLTFGPRRTRMKPLGSLAHHLRWVAAQPCHLERPAGTRADPCGRRCAPGHGSQRTNRKSTVATNLAVRDCWRCWLKTDPRQVNTCWLLAWIAWSALSAIDRWRVDGAEIRGLW